MPKAMANLTQKQIQNITDSYNIHFWNVPGECSHGKCDKSENATYQKKTNGNPLRRRIIMLMLMMVMVMIMLMMIMIMIMLMIMMSTIRMIDNYHDDDEDYLKTNLGTE